MRFRSAITILLALVTIGIPAAGQEKKLKFTVKETNCGKPGDSAPRDMIVVSADGKHIGWTEKREGKWVVVIDGKASEPIEWILANSLVFSAEGGHVAYGEQLADGCRIVIDGKPQKAYAEVNTPSFSKDGARCAYTVKLTSKSKRIAMVLDGVESAEYDRIAPRSLTFSRDGKRFAFTAERGEQRFWVIDGKETTAYDHVTPIEFSRDGSRTAFAGQKGQTMCAVVDGMEGAAFEKVGGINISPDGKHVAHIALITVTVDKKEQKKMCVVIDGKPDINHDAVFEAIFSANSARVAYIAVDGKEACMVIDGKPQKTWEKVLAFRYSGDSKHLMYIVLDERKQRVVLDEKELPQHDAVAQTAISDDGSRWAYTARDLSKTFIMINGKEYPGAMNLAMSTGDGKYIAHGEERLNKVALLVNGMEAAVFDSFLGGSRWVFDTPNKLYVIAARNRELILVELTIEEE